MIICFTVVSSCELETFKAIGAKKGYSAPIYEGTVARLSQRLEDGEAEH